MLNFKFYYLDFIGGKDEQSNVPLVGVRAVLAEELTDDVKLERGLKSRCGIAGGEDEETPFIS